MEVPKDFGQRMTALAEDIPREVIGGLLRTLLPRRPVETKLPSDRELGTLAEAAAMGGPQPRGFAPAKAKRRVPKREMMRKRIEVTLKGGRKLARNGTDGATANLRTMSQCETVAAAFKSGLALGDVLYAERQGYIVLLEGEF